MDMYWVVLTGIPSTYPAFASHWNIGFALTARHFCQTATKVPKKALPHRTALASLRFPHSGPAPWARRHGPSLAHHGSPGIHAGRPTTQNLHSASRRASRSKSKTRSKTRSKAKSKSKAKAKAKSKTLGHSGPLRFAPVFLPLTRNERYDPRWLRFYQTLAHSS